MSRNGFMEVPIFPGTSECPAVMPTSVGEYTAYAQALSFGAEIVADLTPMDVTVQMLGVEVPLPVANALVAQVNKA